MKMYHGTSFENYNKMMYSTIVDIKKNWSVSQDGYIYFYGGLKCSTEECLMRAYNSAIDCAAIKKSDRNFVVVLEIDIDESLLEHDDSDDFGDTDDTRWCMKYSEFLQILYTGKRHEYHLYRYYPEKRWMYLYNIYHSTCAYNWNWAKDYVVDVEEVTAACDEWYETHKDMKEFEHCYEWHFREEIPFMEEFNINKEFGEGKRFTDSIIPKDYNVTDRKVFSTGINLIAVDKDKEFDISKIKNVIDLKRYNLIEYDIKGTIDTLNELSFDGDDEKQDVFLIDMRFDESRFNIALRKYKVVEDIIKNSNKETDAIYITIVNKQPIYQIPSTLLNTRMKAFANGKGKSSVDDILTVFNTPTILTYNAQSVVVLFNDKFYIKKHRYYPRNTEVQLDQLL